MNTSNISTNGNDKLLKILMLEDNENDAELLRMYLKSSHLNIKSTLVSAREDYINALENEEFDVILSDHNLPQFNSLDALRIRNKTKFHIPFILVSGTIPEEYAVAILKEGANDYILKDRPQRLVTAITEAIKKQKTIADKILADQELIRIHERLQLVGKATADAVWDFDVKANTVEWGEGFEKLFGYVINEMPTDLSGRTDHIHPEDLDRVYSGALKVLNSKTETHWEDEYRYKRADGSFATVKDRGIVLRDENGKAYRMVGCMQDITKMKELEREISEQKLNHQKQNTEIAIQAQEEERKHIGKELHDNINQLMAFAKMMLDTARNSPDIREMCMDKSYEGINMAIEEVRKLSHSLVPPALAGGNSFINAVNDIVASIQLSDKLEITVNIPTNGELILSGEKIELTFYRIIQQQMSNILKYAKATKVSITMQIVNNTYQLVITDNGVGFDTSKKSNGIGLRNIKSRTELHSGTMEVISDPGNGCTLKIEIPF